MNGEDVVAVGRL